MTAERQMQYILDHLVDWHNEPRPEGASFFDSKLCRVRFNPGKKTHLSWAKRKAYLAVLNGLIAIEDGKEVAEESTLFGTLEAQQ